ncbi:UDP-N-acetylglucosamine 2-epimerase (non-hydrolyzing) [Candidatus Peribacteria bacterium]|nr:UDP-N-acetylglucosamine 2-epimerase (non-hydrolyzing) [Candidatus Peribacteria bacterium]
MKLAGVVHAFKCHAEEERSDVSKHKHFIIHTGQHSDPLFSDIFFKELDIPDPDYNLGVKSAGNNEETIKATSEACVDALKDANPDVVLVYGDVSGALGGALAAKEIGIPVAHVEAGLRSGDMDMPEERNRIEIDKIAKYLFVTEESGRKNLEKEGIEGEVHFVGNTMIDTLIRMQKNVFDFKRPFDYPDKFGLVTLHRPSNVDSKDNLKKNIDFLNEVAEKKELIFPIHLRTKSALENYNLYSKLSDKIIKKDPLGYIDFLKLIHLSDFVLTDSGGIQEETTFLGVECFTLRKNTERPATESKNGGTNHLIDIDKKEGKDLVLEFAEENINYNERSMRLMDGKGPENWDGKAGEKIIKILT